MQTFMIKLEHLLLHCELCCMTFGIPIDEHCISINRAPSILGISIVKQQQLLRFLVEIDLTALDGWCWFFTV